MTLTQKIFELSAPYNNPYQGPGRRILFVCSAGLLRSPTAADVATRMGFNARSCGSSDCALIPLSVNLILWADTIVFVEHSNYTKAVETFTPVDYHEDIISKAVVWGLPDDYERNDSWLVARIEDKMRETFNIPQEQQ